MKAFCVLLLLTIHAVAGAQAGRLKPIDSPADGEDIPLGTGGVEGSTAPESTESVRGQLILRNIQKATLTPVLPDRDKATGAAIVVAPGGAFMQLMIDGEGRLVARWLADHGIAAFVLKYRLRPTAKSDEEFHQELVRFFRNLNLANLVADAPADAVADASAALALVRSRAERWGVDPSRVGMLGFSAGAIVTLAVTLKATPETMPTFIAPIYGPMNALSVPATAPPLFVAVAADDPLFGNKGFDLVNSWIAARKPVEFHLYQKGSHGFAMGKSNTTTMDWLDSFYHWLDMNGILGKRP